MSGYDNNNCDYHHDYNNKNIIIINNNNNNNISKNGKKKTLTDKMSVFIHESLEAENDSAFDISRSNPFSSARRTIFFNGS